MSYKTFFRLTNQPQIFLVVGQIIYRPNQLAASQAQASLQNIEQQYTEYCTAILFFTASSPLVPIMVDKRHALAILVNDSFR